MALRHLAARDERPEAQAIVQRQRPEAQELAERRQREQLSVVVEAGLRRAEAEAVAHAELGRERAHAIVRRQRDVVEAVGAMAVEVDRSDEAAEL